MVEKKKGPSSAAYRAMGMVTNIGVTFGVSVLIGYYIGHYLDSWLQGRFSYGTPWLTLLFVLMGIGAGFRGVFKLLGQLNDEDKKE
jgi:ATP synthase protein I